MAYRQTFKGFSGAGDMSGLLSGGTAGSGAEKFYELEPAIVIDVIADRPGEIIAVSLISNKEITAYPLNQNIKQIPLRGELVLFSEHRLSLTTTDTRNFYNTLSWLNSTHTNELPFLLNTILSKWKNANRKEAFTNIIKKILGVPSELDTLVTGAYFKEKSAKSEYFAKLVGFEGDTLFQGRTGQTIRFGSAIPNKIKFDSKNIKGLISNSTVDGNGWMFSKSASSGLNPLIMISAGKTNTNESLSLEDIQKDPATIMLFKGGDAGVEFPFLLSAIRAKPKNKSIPSKFNDSMVLITSERLIFNSYKEDIIISSKKDVVVMSEGNCYVKSKKGTFKVDFPLAVTLSGKTVNLGPGAETEGLPIVIYDPLLLYLKRIIDAVLTMRYDINGIPIDSTHEPLKKLKKEFDTAGSEPLFGSTKVFST